MASNRAVAASLKILGRAFAGTVDEARIQVYAAALEDLTDAELATATTLVVKSHTGEFIPPPAVIRKAIAPAPTVIDVDPVLRAIEKLAVYNPNAGMVYPPVAKVRDALGDAAAYAYAAAGGPRIFADSDTTRDIARREFRLALTDAVVRRGSLHGLGADPERLLLAPPDPETAGVTSC
jgi:hypothetical protein